MNAKQTGSCTEMKKKIEKIRIKTITFVVMFIVGAVLLLINYASGEHDYGGVVRYGNENASDLFFNTNGFGLICDDFGNVIKYDVDSQKIICVIESQDYGNENTVLTDAVLSDSGDIFISAYENDGSDYIPISEKIVRFDGNGKKIGDMCRYDYSNDPDPPHRSGRFSCLACKDDTLSFVYCDESGTEFISIDINTGIQTSKGIIAKDEDGYNICEVYPLEDDYLLLRNDGLVFRTAGDELGEPVYYQTFGLDSLDENDFIGSAAGSDGVIYAILSDYRNDSVYKITDGKYELFLSLYDCYDFYMDDEFYEEGYDLFWDYNVWFTDIEIYNGTVYIYSSDNSVISVNESGEYYFWEPDLHLPFICSVKAVISGFFDTAGIIIMIIAALCIIISEALKHRTILTKQLLMILPLAVLMTVIIMLISLRTVKDNYYDQTLKEMAAVSELCALELSESGFEHLTDFDDFDIDIYNDLKIFLKTVSGNNRGFWNRNYDFAIYTISDDQDIIYRILGTDMDVLPFRRIALYIPEEIDMQLSKTDICDVFFFESYSADVEYYTALSLIYNEKGEPLGYLDVSTDLRTFNEKVKKMQLEMMSGAAVCLAVMILAIIGISLYISGTIKKATNTVSQIASGNFSARITKQTHDELGEICRGVNNMAYQLEELFTEKDKTEQFYYKFVPEKFKELLGKEKLTDLSLGDASSKELTVLFCDIRSFSINSEMMTAKENFEFVNVIYGKAGPLVRKYGGFVDKYIGDAVMALFENADDAVNCGIELYNDIVLDPHTAELLNIKDINIGIGIHTGMARIGIVGESERLSGTVISDTVNLSSRLESLTKKYHTAMLISKDTLDRLTEPEKLDLRYLGMIQVAGVNEVKAVYEVLDCLPESEQKLRHENNSGLRESVRLFHLGRRAESVELLRSMIEEGRSDHVIKMYYDYIKGMSDNDKGNVFRFVRK